MVSLTPLQIFSTVVFAASTSLSILAYILVLAIFFLYFKDFKSNFYYIVISLSVSDLIGLSLVLFYMVPCNVLGRDVWPGSGPSILEQLSFLGGCTHLAYIAVNRLIYASASGAKHPTLDKIFYSPVAVGFWIIVLWAAGLVMPIVLLVAGCNMMYDHDYMSYHPNCTDAISPQFTAQVLIVDNVISGFFPCFITVAHTLAWCAVSCRGRQNASSEITQQRKRETRLLIQFTLISMPLILYWASFWAIPYWFPNNEAYVSITFIGISSCAVNPFTYLAFNKVMKAKAKHLFFAVLLGNNKVTDIAIRASGTHRPSATGTLATAATTTTTR